MADLGELPAQLAAKVRGGQRDERFGPLPQRQPEQVHRAVLGHDPVHVARVVTTPAPGLSEGTMRETVPRAAVAGNAMIGMPPFDSAEPRMKSICPPMPE